MQKTQSEAQLLRQAFLKAGQLAWNEATEAIRDQWRAAALLRPFPNRLGQLRTLSGYQFFLKVQLNNRLITGIDPTAIPDITSTPPPQAVSLSLDLSAGFIFTYTAVITTPQTYFFIDMHRPFSTVPRAHYNMYTRLGLTTMNAGSFNFTATYNSTNTTPAIGEILAFKVTSWQSPRAASAPLYITGTVVA
jgi:hypothetical protein